MPESNVTVSATFTVLSPKIAVYTVKHLQQNIADDNYTLTESETKTGKIGDTTDAIAKSYEGFTAQPVTQVTIVESGTEIEIKYDRKMFTVTFNSNGGSDVSSQNLRYGAKATEPAVPTKTATATVKYTFAGWYSDSGLVTPFSFDTATKEDITLYAKWTKTAVIQAGSISYATTTVSKTTDDTAFTNELTKTGDGTVTYSSSEESVATVNADGLVTIVGAGTATITATVTDSASYTYATKTASYTLTVTQAVAPVTYIGSKAPSEAKEVGDIVFNDGSATPYTSDLTLSEEQKAAAIAIIFYKGTDLNSDYDTTTSRTLGVGLKHNKTGLAWCTDSASAYEVNITTIQCPPSGNTGELTFTEDRNGSDNLEQIARFLAATAGFTPAEGVPDDTATEANYPAFYFAKNYSTTATNLGDSYKDGWYLPSIAELFQIYANGKGANKAFDIDAASALCGGDSFGNVYWSSSQSASLDKWAYLLWFDNGFWSGDNRNWDYRPCDEKPYYFGDVCAVRSFN